MISKKEKVKFLINEQRNYSMIELPYKSTDSDSPKSRSASPDGSSETSIVIIVQHEQNGIINLLNINGDAIKRIKKVFRAETKISLPSFEMETILKFESVNGDIFHSCTMDSNS